MVERLLELLVLVKVVGKLKFSHCIFEAAVVFAHEPHIHRIQLLGVLHKLFLLADVDEALKDRERPCLVFFYLVVPEEVLFCAQGSLADDLYFWHF